MEKKLLPAKWAIYVRNYCCDSILKTIFILSVISFGCISAYSQKIPAIHITLEDKTAYMDILVDSTGVVNVRDSLNGIMILKFPDLDANNYSLQFNEKKDVFRVTFNNCDSCLQLKLSDINKNELKLKFEKNVLTQVNDKDVSKKKTVNGKTPFIKIQVEKKAKDDEVRIAGTLNAGDSLQKSLQPDPDAVKNYTFYCGQFKCKDCTKSKTGKENRKNGYQRFTL